MGMDVERTDITNLINFHTINKDSLEAMCFKTNSECGCESYNCSNRLNFTDTFQYLRLLCKLIE